VATHKSAAKRARQTVGRRSRNRAYISSVKSAVKSVKTGVDAVKEGKVKGDELVKIFQDAQSLIMKAGTKGLMHKNCVARRVKMLAGLVKTATQK
jgi:small subunit ribosomal protein S20